MANSLRQLGLTGLGASLLGLAYPNALGFAPLFIFGLAILIYFTQPKHFWSGYFAGLVYFAITFRWFWFSYPLDSVGINNPWRARLLILFVYLITVAVMALAWGFWNKLRQGIWFSAALFVFLEYLRSAAFGLLWFGSGSLLGAHWTMANPVYALTNSPLVRQLSSLVGIYGVLFLILLAISWLTTELTQGRYRLVILGSIGLLLLFYLPLKPPIAANTKNINFALLQTNLPNQTNPSPAEKLNNFKKQLAALNQIANTYPQTNLVLLPEDTGFFADLAIFLNPTQIKNYFSNLFPRSALLISGTRVLDQTQSFSRLILLDSRSDKIDHYDKRLLAPFGEFIPKLLRLAVTIFTPESLPDLNLVHALSVGQRPAATFNFRDQFRYAVIICSELLSPSLVRSTADRSELLLATTSTAFFHGHRSIVAENLAIARWRAAENQKPLLLAANQGASYALDHYGNIQKISDKQTDQILTGILATNPERTWYNKLGDWPIIILTLFILAFTAYHKKDVLKA